MSDPNAQFVEADLNEKEEQSEPSSESIEIQYLKLHRVWES